MNATVVRERRIWHAALIPISLCPKYPTFPACSQGAQGPSLECRFPTPAPQQKTPIPFDNLKGGYTGSGGAVKPSVGCAVFGLTAVTHLSVWTGESRGCCIRRRV